MARQIHFAYDGFATGEESPTFTYVGNKVFTITSVIFGMGVSAFLLGPGTLSVNKNGTPQLTIDEPLNPDLSVTLNSGFSFTTGDTVSVTYAVDGAYDTFDGYVTVTTRQTG